MWLPNPPELLFLLFAIMRIGAIALPLNTRYKSLDLTYALSRSRCVVVINAVLSISEEKIIDYFRGRIANFKIPKRVIFVDELPMTPTGKVQKEVLRKLLET